VTEKQKRFCDEYLIDCNGTRAYKAAYPAIKSDETAKVSASRLLTNANVKAYISAGLEKLHNEKTADAQEVMEYLSAVLRGCKEQVLRGVGKGEQVVDEMQVSAKDRLKAAELLAKRYKMFDSASDSQQTSVEDDPITKSLKEEFEKK
jgi:phage terminase small subunit